MLSFIDDIINCEEREKIYFWSEFNGCQLGQE